nr:hypothetical protein Iba_chr05cCG10160 [Ipomoea batatas]
MFKLNTFSAYTDAIHGLNLQRDENRGLPSKTISFNACCTLVRSGVSVR